MSNRYKHGDRIPSETLCARLDELADAVTKGPAAVSREFTMRVPAELDRDADLVLSRAAQRIRELEGKLHYSEMGGRLTFAQLREANATRCERWHPEGISSWSLSDWATAAAGEMGELCNVIKKLNRVRDDLPGNKESPAQLMAELPKEIADTVLYLDLLAAAAGIDLAEAVAAKFNEVSERNGFPERIYAKGGNS